jgi:hypothetical protein
VIRSACDAEHDSAQTGRLTGQSSQLNLQPSLETASSQRLLGALSNLPTATKKMDLQSKLIDQQPSGHDTSYMKWGHTRQSRSGELPETECNYRD